MGTLIALIYTGWAFYSGWKVLTGRNAWLDAPELPNKIAKALLSVLLGWVIGAFYLIYLLLKFFGLFR